MRKWEGKYAYQRKEHPHPFSRKSAAWASSYSARPSPTSHAHIPHRTQLQKTENTVCSDKAVALRVERPTSSNVHPRRRSWPSSRGRTRRRTSTSVYREWTVFKQSWWWRCVAKERYGFCPCAELGRSQVMAMGPEGEAGLSTQYLVPSRLKPHCLAHSARAPVEVL